MPSVFSAQARRLKGGGKLFDNNNSKFRYLKQRKMYFKLALAIRIRTFVSYISVFEIDKAQLAGNNRLDFDYIDI